MTTRSIPATLAQRGIWFTGQLADLGSVYHLPLTIAFDGDLDVEALRRATGVVLARHPLLACAVRDDDGVPCLVPAPEPRLELADVSTGGVEAHRQREILRPFDLRRGPLVRLTLLRLGPARFELLVVAHHLVFDGASKDILVRDLAAGYRAAVEGSALGLAGLAVTPEEHAAQERDRVEALLPAARAFWVVRRPGGAVPALPDLAPSADPVGEGGSVELALDADLTGRLAAAARHLGATRFELMLAALHALIQRYGNRAVEVAVDVDTRPPGMSDHVGLFVNQLPVGSRPTPGTTLRELVAALRTGLLELHPYREVPLAHAVEDVRPGPALAAVSISYRWQGAPPEFPGVRAAVSWSTFNLAARNVLHLHAVAGAESVELHLRHSPRAIPRSSVERIGRHLVTLLDGAVADPEARLGALPLLASEERRRVLVEWGHGARAAASDATLPELVRARAAERPGAVALVCDRRELTYGELTARAGRLAGRLRRLGVGPEVTVAVCAQRSIDLPVAVLAVLEAGGAYVPLDPAHPPERLAITLADAGAPLLLTERQLLPRLPAAPATLLLDEPETWAESPEADPGPCARPSNLAYVMYTSGSMGRPKGVAVEHRPVVSFLHGMRDLLRSGAGAVWLVLTSFSFDMSVLELFLPLVTGGRAVVAPEAGGRGAEGLPRLVRERGVTHVQATPSGWELLLAAGFDGPGITAISAGEPLARSLADELRRRVGRLVDAYGPTEAAIDVTAGDVGDAGDGVPIGRPLPGARVALLDERLEPVPAGVAGELCIGGVPLARGYFGRPDLTAARFAPDPHGPPGARLYRTGDRARHRLDGRFEYLGRTDGQVKIRGHRVELGEIEARLLEQPGVRHSAVVVRDDAPGGRRVVAYVVLDPQSAPAPETLRSGLARTLHEAMVPSAFVALDSMPLTANGKLDRHALPEPPAAAGRDAADPAPDDLRGQVASIFREVLRVDDVGPEQSLFRLGGHSLSITQIASRVRRRLGVDLPLNVFYDAPTVAGVVEAILRSGSS